MTIRSRRVVRIRTVAEGALLEYRDEALPDVGYNDVLIRVHASSINFHDLAVMSGEIEVADGRIPLCDGAGLVLETGAGVTSLTPGDRVLSTFFPDWNDGPPSAEALARISGDTADGFAADHVVVPQHCLTRMPSGMDYVEASTIPCAGVTAWNALKLVKELDRNSVVVVQGSGGVAIWALTLAKAKGATVVALTSSTDKVGLIKAIGADLVIDLSAKPQWHKELHQVARGRGADLVIEVVGGENLSRSVAACRMGGQIALIGFLESPGTQIQIPDLLLRHIQITGLAVGRHVDQLELIQFLESHSISPLIGRKIALSNLDDIVKFRSIKTEFGKTIVLH